MISNPCRVLFCEKFIRIFRFMHVDARNPTSTLHWLLKCWGITGLNNALAPGAVLHPFGTKFGAGRLEHRHRPRRGPPPRDLHQQRSVSLWGAFWSPGGDGDDSGWSYLETVPRLPGPDPGPLVPAREGATSGPPSTGTLRFLPPGIWPSEGT